MGEHLGIIHPSMNIWNTRNKLPASKRQGRKVIENSHKHLLAKREEIKKKEKTFAIPKQSWNPSRKLPLGSKAWE